MNQRPSVKPEEEWTKPFGPFGCTLLADGNPDNCVLAFGDAERQSCDFAGRRSSPDGCPHWKRITKTPAA